MWGHSPYLAALAAARDPGTAEKGGKKKVGWSAAELWAWGICFLQGALLAFLGLLCSSQSPEAMASHPGAYPARYRAPVSNHASASLA